MLRLGLRARQAEEREARDPHAGDGEPEIEIVAAEPVEHLGSRERPECRAELQSEQQAAIEVPKFFRPKYRAVR